MAGLLDNALKAVEYSTKDNYRWSKKYKLLKRGYTIDTWDFQTTEDTAIAGNDIMVVYPGKTRFGIMFGDNTGMAASCAYLAEMLHFTGRDDEAKIIADLGQSIKQRLDDLAWNGKYYTHHIPEDPSVIRDLGVDEKSQVSLSNAYSLNRGLDHDKCAAIIKTYQAIREQMPVSSPGEWYTIYPPFEKGFGKYDSSSKWEYMNGGVTSIVAGELAHGAFEHGFEMYGADILKRTGELAEKTGNYLHCAYRGAMPQIPQRNFTTLSFKEIANVVYPPREAKRDENAFGYGAKNGILPFHGIPFEVPNTENNILTGIDLSLKEGETPEVTIKVNQQAASIYFLHSRENGPIAGTATLKYEDGTEFIDYITTDKVGFWWSEKNQHNKQLKLIFTGSGEKTRIELLSPRLAEPNAVLLDGKPVQYSVKKIQESRYITFETSGNGVFDVTIKYT